MQRFWVAALFAAVFSTSSSAQSLRAPLWTGFYFGGNIGAGWGDSDVGYSFNDTVSPLLFALSTPSADSDARLLGGLQAGYNYQFDPRWVIGLEADFDWTNLRGSARGSAFSGAVATAVDQNVEWFGTVRGRLGYLPAPNLLTYVTGGFAYGKVDRSASYSLGPNAGIISVNPSISCFGPAVCLAGSSSDVQAGWTLGGGFEYALWQNWTIRAEYLHVDLGPSSVTERALVFTPGTTPLSFNANGRAKFDIVRAGVSYRF